MKGHKKAQTFIWYQMLFMKAVGLKVPVDRPELLRSGKT
jgi:hypothetical protein